MSKLLSEWSPSDKAIDLLKLNRMTDDHIKESVKYLKAQKQLDNIDDIEGYESWNAFFIMFCIKANGKNEE